MDLPVDVWDKVGQKLDTKEWAKTCGISQAAHAARRSLVAAEVHSDSWDGEQVCMTQLQLEKWPTCHSLYLNLQQLHETRELTPEQSAQIETAARKSINLHCLHIIGRSQVPLIESSMEGVLMRLLARHASILTLQVNALTMPLNFPDLQHLVLDLGALSHQTYREQNDWGPFLSVSTLKSLKTLYVQAPDTQVWEATALTGCTQLQCVAVHGIQFAGKQKLALPEACLLHVISTATTCGSTRNNGSFIPGVAPLITGLAVHNGSPWLRSYQEHAWEPRYIYWSAPQMHNLKQMRLVVNKEDLGGHFWTRRWLQLHLHINKRDTPALEVLELSVQCNLAICIESGVPLKSVVLKAARTLNIDSNVWFQGPLDTVQHMYLQSSSASFPSCKTLARHPYYVGFLGLRVKPIEFAKEGRKFWTARMPAGFQPSNLQECWCSACPECLARAGVPILCDQAWTRDGFAKHLRPYCSRHV